MSWLSLTVLLWTLGYTCLFPFWFPQCVCPAVGLLGRVALSSRSSLVLLHFLPKGGVICITEVIDISPGNLDSCLFFIQPTFRMMYSACKLNKQSNYIQPWRTPFPTWTHSVVPCLVLTIASWPEYRFLKRQVRWSGIPISFRILHSCDPHSQRLWHGQ